MLPPTSAPRIQSPHLDVSSPQRETLLHARDSANEIAENLAESRKFVKMIQRRMAQNKVISRYY
jgi:hypothetical protein